MPEARLDDIEHNPAIAAARHDDMSRLARAEQHKRQWHALEAADCEVERPRLQAKPRACDQERRLVEAGRRNSRQLSDIGLTHGPTDLLGDIKQRSHERVDRPAPVGSTCRRRKPSILQRGHSPSAPADLFLPLRVAKFYAKSNI